MPAQALLTDFPPHQLAVGSGRVQWRQAGAAPAPTLVLLHGIGSASASWLPQLGAAQGLAHQRVLAWDAPGYGHSSALEPEHPTAADYAQRLWAWLDALQAAAPLTLAGHSLGALMAAAAARLQPQRVQRLVLLSPARGYGAALAQEREGKLNDRLAALQRFGPAGLAERRAAAMLSPQATPALVDAVRATMAQVHPAGYTQAARMLAGADLCADVQALTMPRIVACGDADGITPPAACAQVAAAAGVPLQSLGPAGHACALEAAEAVNALLGLPLP